MSKDEGAPENNLDERIQQILKTVASSLYAFRNRERSGTFEFCVKVEGGQIPDGGFTVYLDEKVL